MKVLKQKQFNYQLNFKYLIKLFICTLQCLNIFNLTLNNYVKNSTDIDKSTLFEELDNRQKLHDNAKKTLINQIGNNSLLNSRTTYNNIPDRDYVLYDKFILNKDKRNVQSEHDFSANFKNVVDKEFKDKLIEYYEDEHFSTYRITTPIFPKYISVDDVQIYIQNDQLQVRILGTGNAFNKDRPHNYGYHTLRREWLYKSRDWEVWINLYDRLKNTANPAIKKFKNEDGSFIIEVKFSLLDLDINNSHFKNSVSTISNDKSIRLYSLDSKRLSLPKYSMFINRQNNKSAKEDNSEYNNIITVESRTPSKNISILNERLDKNYSNEQTKDITSLLNKYQRKSAIVNIDSIDKRFDNKSQLPYLIHHDPYYNNLISVINQEDTTNYEKNKIKLNKDSLSSNEILLNLNNENKLNISN